MATLRREFTVARPPEEVWERYRDFGAVHTRLARGFVTDTKVEPGARVVTFANGLSARERLVTLDDQARRIVYAIQDSPNLEHYSASAQVFADGGASRVVWTVDLLPDARAEAVGGMMDAGVRAMQTTLS